METHPVAHIVPPGLKGKIDKQIKPEFGVEKLVIMNNLEIRNAISNNFQSIVNRPVEFWSKIVI